LWNCAGFVRRLAATTFKKSRKSRDDASAASQNDPQSGRSARTARRCSKGIVDRGFVKEAEALIEGILAIVKSKDGSV
jgi:hypothetical protein